MDCATCDARAGTRHDVRPFNLVEQRRMLLVGACLDCHDERGPAIAGTYADFAHYRQRVRPPCVLPADTE